MKLEAYRCQSCSGIALVDVMQLMPNIDLPCPYCFGHPNRNAGEMVGGAKTLLRYPNDFSAQLIIESDAKEG
jgi:hypothetical protein